MDGVINRNIIGENFASMCYMLFLLLIIFLLMPLNFEKNKLHFMLVSYLKDLIL